MFSDDQAQLFNPITNPQIRNQLVQNGVLNMLNINNADIQAVNRNLQGLKMSNANVTKCNLNNVDLTGALLNGTFLNGSNLNDAILTGAEIEDGHFIDAKLQGAFFNNINSFKGTVFTNADCRGINLNGSNLYDANFTGADFRGTDFTGIDFTGVLLNETDFRGAILEGVDFRGSSIDSDTKFEGAKINADTKFDLMDLTKKQKQDLGIQTNVSILNMMNVKMKKSDVNSIISIINKGNWDPTEFDSNGLNALELACHMKNIPIIRALINSGKINLGEPNKNTSYTILILSIVLDLKDIALELIRTGQSNPGHKDSNKITALMYACDKNFDDVALELIATGQSDPGYQNDFGDTALMYACKRGNVNIALKLISTGQSDPGVENDDGDTALTICCENALMDVRVAIELINTGESNPGNINNAGETALTIACRYNIEDIINALIATDDSNPGHSNQQGYTALMLLCDHDEEDMALDLIHTGESNMYKISRLDGRSAEQIATENNLDLVLNEFLMNINKNVIDVYQEVFDYVLQEHKIIDDHLKEDGKNIVFKIDNHYYVTNIDYMANQMKDIVNKKYGCREAGETQWHIDDMNINYHPIFFDLSSLIGLKIFIDWDDAQNIIELLFGRLIILQKRLTLPAIISQAFLDGDRRGSDNCQPDRETDVYDVIPAIPDPNITKKNKVSVVNSDEDDGPSKRNRNFFEESKFEGELQESKEEFIDQNPPIKVKYGENLYILSSDVFTLDQFKDSFLNTLLQNNKIENKNYNVRFFCNGKPLSTEESFTNFKNKPDQCTILAMINAKLGGRTRKRHNKKVTKRKGYKRRGRKTMNKKGGKGRKTVNKRK